MERSRHGRSSCASLIGEPATDGVVEIERAARDLVAGAANDDGLAIALASAWWRQDLAMIGVDVFLITWPQILRAPNSTVRLRRVIFASQSASAMDGLPSVADGLCLVGSFDSSTPTSGPTQAAARTDGSCPSGHNKSPFLKLRASTQLMGRSIANRQCFPWPQECATAPVAFETSLVTHACAADRSPRISCGEIWRHGHRTSGRPNNDLVRRKRTAVAIDVVGEPAVQCAEPSPRDLAQNVSDGLRAHPIPLLDRQEAGLERHRCPDLRPSELGEIPASFMSQLGNLASNRRGTNRGRPNPRDRRILSSAPARNRPHTPAFAGTLAPAHRLGTRIGGTRHAQGKDRQDDVD